jgi:hypothetical protein
MLLLMPLLVMTSAVTLWPSFHLLAGAKLMRVEQGGESGDDCDRVCVNVHKMSCANS